MPLGSPITPSLSALAEAFPDGITWINEAAFGHGHIVPYLRTLPAGSSVLEVGCGSGLLLAQLSQDFPTLHFTGIEPLGPGFSALQQLQQRVVEQHPFTLQQSGYEAFAGDGSFDLIYLINVFEHLPDWHDFLAFIRRRLRPNGQCIVLCPNYGFPYESHFGLPIIGTKTLTHRIFRDRIAQFETQRDAYGLWSSLNFVTWSQVKHAAPHAGLAVRFVADMTRQMIVRLAHDDAFRRRQAGIARVASLVEKSGALWLLERPLLHRFHPYMKLEFSIA